MTSGPIFQMNFLKRAHGADAGANSSAHVVCEI